jgi:hypothetical protein
VQLYSNDAHGGSIQAPKLSCPGSVSVLSPLGGAPIAINHRWQYPISTTPVLPDVQPDLVMKVRQHTEAAMLLIRVLPVPLPRP